MRINPVALSIRAKKLGVLMRDARQAAGKTIEECAKVLGVPEVAYEEYELGDRSPSLPELEVLSFFLEIPIDHFWADQAISVGQERKVNSDFEQLVKLRQRVIGALLRQARLNAGLSLEELAEKGWSSPTLLEAYELGDVPVPLPDLEALSSLLDQPLKSFEDRHGPVGAWAAQQRALQDFITLSPELQAFVSKPINRPYLELAQRLSEMSVDKLRGVAEGLLEITL